MYLLVRDLTGRATAARWPRSSPGSSTPSCRFASRRSRTFSRSARSGCRLRCTASAGSSSSRSNRVALAGGTAALLMQNWSCGYYLILLRAVRRRSSSSIRSSRPGALRDWRLWAAFAVRRARGRRRHVAVSRAVPRSAARPRLRAAAWRGHPLLGGRLQLLHRARSAAALGPVMQAYPETRRRAVLRRRADALSGASWRSESPGIADAAVGSARRGGAVLSAQPQCGRLPSSVAAGAAVAGLRRRSSSPAASSPRSPAFPIRATNRRAPRGQASPSSSRRSLAVSPRTHARPPSALLRSPLALARSA